MARNPWGSEPKEQHWVTECGKTGKTEAEARHGLHYEWEGKRLVECDGKPVRVK